MIEAGIVDPVKVARTALQNAVSVASLLLTTDCMVVGTPAPDTASSFGGVPPDRYSGGATCLRR